MSNADSPAAVLRSFAQLSAHYRRAVVLKSQGRQHRSIAATINKEFGVSCSHNTVNQWFSVGGLLEQAYSEYSEQLADMALKEARSLARRHSKTSIETMVELMKSGNDPTIRLGAARALANKYLPDRQTIYSSGKEEVIPADLIEEGDHILDELNTAA